MTVWKDGALRHCTVLIILVTAWLMWTEIVMFVVLYECRSVRMKCVCCDHLLLSEVECNIITALIAKSSVNLHQFY